MADLKNCEPASNFALKRAKNSTVTSNMLKAPTGGHIMRITSFFLWGGVVFQVERNVTSVDSAKCLGCLLMRKQVKMRIK